MVFNATFNNIMMFWSDVFLSTSIKIILQSFMTVSLDLMEDKSLDSYSHLTNENPSHVCVSSIKLKSYFNVTMYALLQRKKCVYIINILSNTLLVIKYIPLIVK